MNNFIAALLILFSFFGVIGKISADVYGGGRWEAIGLGNMQCSEFITKTTEESYRELGAVWLSGFMSGVNFTSEDVYDITWNEDLYALTDLVIKRCEENPEKYLSDVVTEMVYQRYQDKNFTASDQKPGSDKK